MAPMNDVPDVPVWRLTVEQYEQMIVRGILENADEVELLEGWLIPKMGKNPPHGTVIRRLQRLLQGLAGNAWDIHMQDPIKLSDGEPEPDVSVVPHDANDYIDHLPAGDDVGLVIEVADTTLRRDRGIKLRSYARAGLPDYWVVNLSESWIEVYTEPSGPGPQPVYRKRTDYRVGQSVPVRLRGQLVGELAAGDILP